MKEYCKLFKYALECTGKLPPVNLNQPQMAFKLKREKKPANLQQDQKRNSGPKTVLFDDNKKQDLFDFEEGDIESDDRKFSEADDIKIDYSNSDLED